MFRVVTKPGNHSSTSVEPPRHDLERLIQREWKRSSPYMNLA